MNIKLTYGMLLPTVFIVSLMVLFGVYLIFFPSISTTCPVGSDIVDDEVCLHLDGTITKAVEDIQSPEDRIMGYILIISAIIILLFTCINTEVGNYDFL